MEEILGSFKSWVVVAKVTYTDLGKQGKKFDDCTTYSEGSNYEGSVDPKQPVVFESKLSEDRYLIHVLLPNLKYLMCYCDSEFLPDGGHVYKDACRFQYHKKTYTVDVVCPKDGRLRCDGVYVIKLLKD